MQLHLHPTRREALTVTEKAITRWSLETNPATVLAQMSTDPESLFSFSYSAPEQVLTCGGITGSPDGLLFAHERLGKSGVIEWRNWDDLSVAHSGRVPDASCDFASLACSPDGRWLVLQSVGQRPHHQGVRRNTDMLFLLDWQTGKLISRHDIQASFASSLTFDTTSTFVAGVIWSYDGGSFLQLCQLDPVERFVPRPLEQDWSTGEIFSPDEVSGSMALTLLYVDWERMGVDWPNPSLADAPGFVTFSPDSHIVLLSLHSSLGVGECALVAYEVPSGKLLWGIHHEKGSLGQPIFSPDSRIVLLPELGGDLLVYDAEDGRLSQRLPTGLSKPIQALAFDHDGATLWLATEETLVQYQPHN